MDKVFRSVIKYGIFLTLLAPFVMSSRFFFPFIVPKNILFRITVEVIFALYLILAIADKKYRPRFDNKLIISVMVFFGIMLLTTFTGIGVYRSVWGNYERMGGIFGDFHLLIYFFVLINVFKDKKTWHQFLTFSIFVSLVMCFIALAQQLQAPFLLKSAGGQRLTGSIGNATFFASYLLFNLFFILYFFTRVEKDFEMKLFLWATVGMDLFLILFEAYLNIKYSSPGFIGQAITFPAYYIPILLFQLAVLAVWFLRNKKYVIKSFLAVLAIFEFFIFFNTQTRGAILGFIFGVLLFFILTLFFSTKKNTKIIYSALMLAIILGGVLVYLGKDSGFIKGIPTLHRLATISWSDITTQSRFLAWQAGWQGWQDRFILGYGPENFYVAFDKHFPAEIFRDKGSQIWFDRAHNVIFDVGVTTGIVGLLSYLAMLAITFYILFILFYKNRTLRSLLWLAALLVAYFFQNLFVFDTLNTSILFYLLLAFIVFLFWERQETAEETQTSTDYIGWENMKLPSAAIIFIVLAAMIYFFNVKLLVANNYIVKAAEAKAKVSNGYSQEAVDYYKLAINQAVTGHFEARQQLADYARELIRAKKIESADAYSLQALAVSELNKSVKEEPTEVRHHLYLGAFCNSIAPYGFNHLNEAAEVLNQAIPLSPTRPQIYFELGQTKFYQGKVDEAIKLFEKGVSLNPNVVDSRLDLIVAYLAIGLSEKAEAEMKFIKDTFNYNFSTQDYLRFVRVYETRSEYGKAIEILKKIIEIESDNPNYYAELAALYAKIGRNQDAIKATNKAVELDPSFAAEAKLFIEKLNSGELLAK